MGRRECTPADKGNRHVRLSLHEHLAARTRFSGRFVRAFTGFGGEPIRPNGHHVEYSLINIFRFAPNGQLIEEWVEYDPSAFLTQLTAQD